MNKKRYLSHLFGIVSIILLVVSVFPLARADTIDQYDSANVDSEPVIFVQGTYGQCFKPTTSAFVTSAGFWIKNVLSAGGTWSIRLYSTTGTFGSTCIQNALLAETPDFIGTTIGSSSSMVIKSFSTQVLLEANVAYAVALALKEFTPSPCCSSGQGLTQGSDTISPSHNGNAFTCAPSCGASAGSDVSFIVSGTLSTSEGIINQCYGNCATLANTNTTSTINFNITQTIFYRQQITTDGFAVNMSTVVGKNYAISFGMRLYLGLYATDLTCQSLTTPFTPSCPGFLLRTESFNNPQKGTQTMFLNNALKSGQFVGIAFSASRDGLVLNDTTIETTSFKVSGIMPALITQFESNGNIKANLKLNVATNIVLAPPPTGEVTPTLGDWLLDLIDNFSSGNRIAGGIFWFFAFSIGIIIGVPIVLASRNIDMPRGGLGILIPFVFVGTSTMFSSLGALPSWIPILIFLMVAYLFAGKISGRD